MKTILEKVRKTVNKYKIAIGIEVAVLLLAGVYVGISFKREYDKTVNSAITYVRDATILINRMSINDVEASVSGMTNYLTRTLSDTYDNPYIDTAYGLVWELYDSEGNLLEESGGNYIMLQWGDETTDAIDNYDDRYVLDNFFPEQELEKLDVCYEESNVNWKVRELTGYWEDGKFIPVEITIFNDGKDGKEITLVNDKEKNREGITYTTKKYAELEKYWCELSIIKKTDKINKQTAKVFDKYHKKETIVENIIQGELVVEGALYEEEAYGVYKNGLYISAPIEEYNDEGEIINSEVKGIAMAVYVDVVYMVLTSSYFIDNAFWGFFLCQFVGIFLICIYVSNEKRKRKLDNIRNTFINAMAHEMKTPAAVIMNSAECIKAGINPENQEFYLEALSNEAIRMNELLNSMLTYARISDGDYEVKIECISLKGMLEEVVGHYNALIEKKNINLQWDVKAEYIINGDIRLIHTVIDNYISNAVKYCKERGGIRISLKEDNLCVFNEGELIDEKIKERIWEPLFMGEESRKQTAGSSGMGLAICAGILKLHNMEYGVKNLANGVEFWIRLK